MTATAAAVPILPAALHRGESELPFVTFMEVPPTNRDVTDVWFASRDANLNLDDEGGTASVWDARFLIDVYRRRCREAGHPRPAVIGL